MADLMHREPDCWQAAGPEEEEADKVPCSRSRATRHAIGNIVVRGPDRANHEGNAFACTSISLEY